MQKEKPRRGHAARRGTSSRTMPAGSIRSLARNQPHSAPPLDLVGLRARLVGARRRLVERLADDFPADRRFPDSGWTKMLADIHIAIAAVDAVAAEDRP